MSLTSAYCVLLLAVLCVWVSAQPAPPDGKQCPTMNGEPGCVCNHPDGIINLTSLADTNKPRYDKLSDSIGYTYFFNPCFTFNHKDCKKVYICQGGLNGSDATYDVADTDEQIWYDSNTGEKSPYLYYTGPGNRNTRVYLECDRSVTEPQITTDGDKDVELSYVFHFKSASVCPGGAGPNPPGPPGGAGETVAGPIGIAIIFVLLIALVAYFIIGAVIMKVKFEKTGREIIPNKEFWFAFPLLIKDGCLFTFSPCINAIRARRGGYQPA